MGGGRAEDASLDGEALRARLSELHSRGLRLGAIRHLAVMAIPIWIQAHTSLLPGLLSWSACLLFAFAGAETALYAGLEEYWARRGARRTDISPAASIHASWSRRDEVCSGLGYGLGFVSIVPWGAVLLGVPLPADILQPLTWLALALVVTWGGLLRW